MKSSPKSKEMSLSSVSKTPQSGKKLVQAHLPFKTMGGSEPPVTPANDTTDTALTTLNTDSRKPLIKIKLPVKKSKKLKKSKKPEPSTPTKEETLMDEEEPQDISMDVDEDIDMDEASTSKENEITSDAEDFNASALNDSILSNASEQCLTPANHKLTPKQMQRRLESEKKKQEKEQARLDRERKFQGEKELRQREKVEKELQKKREREEKEEQRKKEKEVREQKLLEEKIEKQREKDMKEQQKKIEREEKEEQRKREKEERELQKKKEREEKEREKEEERKKKEEEKRQKIEAEQNKNRKTAEAFAKFFVPKRVDNKGETHDNDENMDFDQISQMFMSFQLKEGMKMAPITRRLLKKNEKTSLERSLSSENPSVELYLSQLKKHTFLPRKSVRTLQDDEDEKCSNGDDLLIIEDGEGVQVLKDEPKKFYRAKFLKFSENRRPPYYGTWRKSSETVGPRKPLGFDSRLDYEVDSDDEWEEEEPGESLHGSDDEKEVESEDEYEIDNEFFVPHGHLSDEELQNEDECEFNDPENLKFKLKIANKELEDERKKKTQKLKPRLIGLIWQNDDGSKPSNCSNGVWELMNKHALLFNGTTVKVEQSVNQQADNSDDENSHNKSLGVRRLQIGEKEIPDLIRLINGNQNSRTFLAKEFSAYLAKNHQSQRDFSSASIKAKIKELAIWQACPEEGDLYKKMCWYVPIQTRKRYNVSEPTFPNKWSYIIPPRRPVEITEADGENKTIENKDLEKKAELPDVIALSDDSNSCTLSETLTPELIKQASSKRAPYNIAKFIRPLTEHEKKKQFEPITLSRHPSEDQITEKHPNEIPLKSQATENIKNPARGKKRASKSSTEGSAPKKRVNLLMSGPVGHELSPRLKTTLVTQFLSSNLRKRKSTELGSDSNEISSTSTAGTSDGAKKTKLSGSVIVID